MNTELTYRYANAAGDFAERSVVLRGNIEEADQAILRCCEEWGDFIPNEVGLPDLQLEVETVPGQAKPRWHKVWSISSTSKPPTVELNLDLDTVINRFQDAHDAGWPISGVGASVGRF